MKKEFVSKITLGFTIFSALLTLAFRFNHDQVSFLLDSSYKWIVWIGMTVSASILLAGRKYWRKPAFFAMGMIYGLVPFAFYFSDEQVRWIVLGKHREIAAVCWGIALLLFCNLASRSTRLA